MICELDPSFTFCYALMQNSQGLLNDGMEMRNYHVYTCFFAVFLAIQKI